MGPVFFRMRRHFSILGKQVFVYGVSAAALQAVGVVTLPIFARKFSPSQYGALEIATVGLSAMLMLADLGMASASQRSYFDYRQDQATERRDVLSTALIVSVVAALTISVVILLLRVPLADWLFGRRQYVHLVVLVAIAMPLAVIATFLREVMRLHFRAWHYAISATLAAVITAAVGIWLVLATGAGISGVLIGVICGNGAAVLYGAAVAGRQIGTRISRGELRIMLAFGLPLVPAAAALWGLAFLDRIMLAQLGSLHEVGEYAVGARFATILMFGVTAFGLAWSPFMLSVWSEDRELEKRLRSRVLTYVTILFTGASLALALFAREITTVIAPAYTQAYRVVGVLGIGVTLYAISSVTMAGISFARRSRLFAAFTLGATLVNVVLNFALIPPLGGLGAAIATMVGYGVLAVGYYLKSQQLYPTPFQPRKSITVLALGAALMPLGFVPLGGIALGLKFAALAVFAAGVFALRVFDASELEELRRMRQSLLRRPVGPPRAEATPSP
jgi:O-antigen/teichoic acid export membrane protein